MKKILVTTLFALTSCHIAMAEGIKPAASNVIVKTEMLSQKPTRRKLHDMSPAERAKHLEASLQLRNERFGGSIVKPNSQQGKIVIVNAQSIISADDIKYVADTIAFRDRLNIEFIKSNEEISYLNATGKKHELGANCAVFVIESMQDPNMMITAPEGCWSIINATAVCKGAKNHAFKKTRLLKMVERGYYCACGAMNSKFEGSLMSAVSNPEELDRLANRAPMDVVGRTLTNLEEIGVTPKYITTYKKACQQGWAPAPTNDVQKAVWDQVHAIPKNPMKIEFDPKKGR